MYESALEKSVAVTQTFTEYSKRQGYAGWVSTDDQVLSTLHAVLEKIS